jgi:hypothetical protein
MKKSLTAILLLLPLIPALGQSYSIAIHNGTPCPGQSVSFRCDGPSASSYSWKINGNSISSSPPGQPQILAISSWGYGSSATVTCTVNGQTPSRGTSCSSTPPPKPVFSIAIGWDQFPRTVFCDNENIVFQANHSPATAIIALYRWYKKECPSCVEQEVTGQSTNRYDPAFLDDDDEIRVEAHPFFADNYANSSDDHTLPPSVISIRKPVTMTPLSCPICSDPVPTRCQNGASTTQFTTNVDNLQTGETVTWTVVSLYGGGVSPGGVGNGQVLWNPDFVGTARVRASVTAGCGGLVTQYKDIEVKPTVIVTASIAGPTTACPNGNQGIAFTGNVSGQGTNPTYEWMINGLLAPTSPNGPGNPKPGAPDLGPLTMRFERWDYPNPSTVQLIVRSSASCSSPNPKSSNTIPVSHLVKKDFTVGIKIAEPNPDRVYCAEEIDLVATPSHTPVTYTWSKNWVVVGTGESYPHQYNPNDNIDVWAETSSTECLSDNSAGAVFDHAHISIQQPIGPAEIFPTIPDGVCGGQTSYFYAVAENAKSYQWTVDDAQEVVASGSNNANLMIKWPLNYSGSPAIKVIAKGCVGDNQPDTYFYPVHQNPVTPSIGPFTFCDFEQIRLSHPISGDIAYYQWYTSGGTFVGQGEGLPPSQRAGNYDFQGEAVSKYGCVSLAKVPVSVAVISDCDEKLNRIESIQYNVENSTLQTIGNTKSYFDGMGRHLQTQVKNFTSNEVLSSSSLPDRYGRNVISSLTAPINRSSFQYKHWFMLASSQVLYDHTRFGQPLDSSTPGTLGWYYSTNNNKEQNVPVTGYPFSQVDFYPEASDGMRFAAGAGEVLHLGQGKETLSGTFPVFDELSDYLTKRLEVINGITQSSNARIEGVQSVSRDQNGRYVVQIADKSGKTLLTARAGTLADHMLQVNNIIKSSGDKTSPDFRPLTYIYILQPEHVSITESTDFVVEDILNDRTLSASEINGVWPVGFYRIAVNNESQITISCHNFLTDVSYQFYDDAGRLRASVSPNGYKAWTFNVPYSKIDKTTYDYNHQGWLLKLTEPDAGTTQYVHRRDGKIRFSQNAEQAKDRGPNESKRFSYTHYDQLGRPVESGEYLENALTFKAMDEAGFKTSLMGNELEETANQTTLSNVKKDWVKTYYDLAASSIPNLPSGYVQTYVRGAISWTENENIKTWYSYDELGRVTWMAQMPVGLARTFVTQYSYDFVGNVKATSTTSYRPNPNNPSQPIASGIFYHHYEYDADTRLSQVFTSPDGANKTLRATYEYYLHGPLKRIELGRDIQGIDFVYNIHGWLTQINHPDGGANDPGKDGQAGENSGFKSDVFGMVIDYYESALQGVFQSSGILKSNRPEIFHKLPELGKEVDSPSLTTHNKPPVLFFRGELLKNLRDIKQGQPGHREKTESLNKKDKLKVGAMTPLDRLYPSPEFKTKPKILVGLKASQTAEKKESSTLKSQTL